MHRPIFKDYIIDISTFITFNVILSRFVRSIKINFNKEIVYNYITFKSRPMFLYSFPHLKSIGYSR